MNNFSFELLAFEGSARRGRIKTPHGIIETPVFMPVGTRGSVKALGPDDLTCANVEIILANTYHLMLRPGQELIRRAGGIHKFISWDKPLLTDSGGFQVFSLARGVPRGIQKKSSPVSNLVSIDDNGVTFRSYIDGSIHRMTPEESIRIQTSIGADFIMAFDQCSPGECSKSDARRAMERTTRWLHRSISAVTRNDQKLFGIIQGGTYDDLRKEHAQIVSDTNLFGYAVGGLSVGEEKQALWNALSIASEYMPKEKPRYLMGVGTPRDLLEGIARGVDMFDCVMPTRNARNGTLFTSTGKISIKQSLYRTDNNPLDANCECYACTKFSRSYLRHLFICNELLFYRLASLHNLTHYMLLMKKARETIETGTFYRFLQDQRDFGSD